MDYNNPPPQGEEEENQEHLVEQEIIEKTTRSIEYEPSSKGGNFSDVKGQIYKYHSISSYHLEENIYYTPLRISLILRYF